MYRYAFVIISNGGEIMTFSSEVKKNLSSDGEIYDEVKSIHNLADEEIVDVVVISSKSKVEFEQMDLGSLIPDRESDLDDDDEDDVDDTDRAPNYSDDDGLFNNEDNDYEYDD